jgi:hypothetical protein
MNPLKSLHVDGEPKELCRFAVPPMNLSSSRAEMKRHSFVITAKAAELVRYLEPAYAEWVRESLADDTVCGAPQDELAEAGYPPLEGVFQSPPLLELVVGSYLLWDFMPELTWDGSSPIEYWFDEVTECRSDDHSLRLAGVCYSKQGQ